jgi:signal transduction histidine kinase
MGKKAMTPRLGLRGKLLAFLGVAIISILALEIVAQRLTYAIAEEYETHLSRYHLVHRLRVALNEFRISSDRFLREPGSIPVEVLYETISTLAVLDNTLKPLEDLSIEAGFEVRAIGYGLDAFLPLMSRSYSMRLSGKPDYYADFAKAERIAGYVDTYLSRLFSILMKDGELRFREAATRTKTINDAILIGMIAAGALLLLYVYIVANSITKPIRNLAKASEKLAQGDLDVKPLFITSKDEVGILADNFFAMSASIRTYIEGLKEKADLEKRLHEEETSLLSMGKALREAQLMNLQDQMRPHFLFNALNSIARNALLEGAGTTEKLTISLAKLLRATMKEGGPYIPLSEELDIVREYLGFQKTRFGTRLEWKLDWDESLGAMKIPRFLLQPLVENAVRHGVEPKPGQTEVRVAVRRRGSSMVAHVIDTGMGIENAMLQHLRLHIEKGTTKENRLVEGLGIGLANVATRLYILYGDAGTLRLYSQKGKGTIVKLKIPLDGAPH